MKHRFLISLLTFVGPSILTLTIHAQSLPGIIAPIAPAPQWVVSDTGQIFLFGNIKAGQGGDEVEWSTNSLFQNSSISASPAVISMQVEAGTAVVIWMRTRNSNNNAVSSAVSTLGRVVLTPAASITGELDASKNIAPCGSNLIRQSIYENNPALFQKTIELDNALILKAANPARVIEAAGGPAPYIIPLVFHIVNQQGAGNGISYAQILSQVNKMNASFAADYAGYNGQSNDSTAVNTNIRFCLAQHTYPSNIQWTDSTEPGVMRYFTNDPQALKPPANNLNGCSNLTQTTGYPVDFPPDKYFNIWVVPQISGSTGGSEVLGFATFPQDTGILPATLDGMVIESQVCGDNSLGGNFNLLTGEDEGKVAVHEAGHYFGAYHVFEPNGVGGVNTTCVPQAGCGTNGDFCCDTKPCLMLFGTCTLANSCTGANDYPVANFMNYLNPSCVSAFTADQLNNRFIPALTASNRYYLWQADNLALTGSSCGPCVLTAAIYPTFTGNCPGVGSPVQYNTLLGDLYCASAWSWSFPGGTPSSSSLSAPSVTYVKTGTYTAYLTAYDNGGNSVSDSITINVSSATLTANIVPLATTVCSGSSQEIALIITNGGAPPYRIQLSNGDVIDSLKFTSTTWVLQNLQASQNITITSINNNVCASVYTGQADINVVQCCAENLVRNGDFAQGNTGFTSELTYAPTQGQQPNLYNIYDPSKGDALKYWARLKGLQSLGIGMFMDGNYNPVHPTAHPPYSVYWQEDSIPVDTCTNYRFSFEITDVECVVPNSETGYYDSILPVIVQFDILNQSGVVVFSTGNDTVPIKPPSMANDTGNAFWTQFTFNWNSGQNTGNYTLQIRQIVNFSGQGCDYAFDNITFSKVANTCITLPGSSQNICSGQCTTLGPGIPAYSAVNWQPPLGLSNAGAIHPQACPFETTTYTGTVFIDSGTYCGTVIVVDTVNIDAPVANAGSPYYTVCQLPVAIGSDTAAEGGKPPYIYSWAAPAGGLSSADSASAAPAALKPGVYTLIITDALNCSAIDWTNVQLHTSIGISDSTLNICHGCDGVINLTLSGPDAYGPYTFKWNNGQTTQNLSGVCSGNYIVTVQDITGCAQTLSTTITADTLNYFSSTINQAICFGDTFEGRTITGTYYDTVSNPGTCDSIITLNLRVNPIAENTFHANICQGGNFQFAGKTLTAAGNYQDTIISSAGCDSILILNLTVSAALSDTINYSICPNSNYPFNGQLLTQPGTYQETLTSVAGCDSLVTLNLMVKSTLTDSFSQNICADSAYLFAGQLLNRPGTYTDTLLAAGGCDSVVTLILSFQPADTPTISGPAAGICSNDSAFICAPNGFAVYLWNTGDSSACIYASKAGGYYTTVTNSSGCSFVSPHFELQVFQPPNVSVNVAGDTLKALNAVKWQWYMNDILLPSDTDSICIAQNTGTYTVLVTDTNGCTGISNGELIKVNGISILNEAGEIKLYPNPNTGIFVLEFNDNLSHEVEITDDLGSIILKAKITKQHNFDLSSLATGIYFLRLDENSQQQCIQFSIMR